MIKYNNDIIDGGVASPAESIRKFILDNDLKNGSRLPTHAQLCEILGLGSRRLREGLSVLEREGIIATRGRGGTVVTDPDLDRLDVPIAWHLDKDGCSKEDLVRARARLESAVVVEACEKRTARDLLELLDAIEQMQHLGEIGQCDNAVDEMFHLALLRATHNPALCLMGQLISSQFHRKVQDQIVDTAERQRVSLQEHRRLLELIEKRDAENAAKLMYEHVMVQVDV